ncbi:hypothetical protein AB4Z29_31985 [Paenibacillus sp. 2TAB23]|uniref:hypothetical protein n=1 Tax=Paenibacillus sp. 2TAB23 TaxID=3233004 RepID=UPI003F9D6B8A
MQTYIDRITDISNQAYSQLLTHLAAHHTSNDIAKYIKDIGSEVELFLKEGIYNNTRNRDTFEVLVNHLVSQDVSQTSIDSLHELRKKYNKAKHDPSTIISGKEAMTILQDTNKALVEIKNVGLGISSRNQSYERILWFAGWDHITSGDTEISIMIPSTGERLPPALDYFNIVWDGWEPLISHFVKQGQLLLGREQFPEKVYDILSGGDFLDAGVFIGDYRELILEISKYVDLERESRLLPNLQRKNDPNAIYYAMVYATCDVISEGMFVEERNELEEALLIIANYKYAVDTASQYARKLAPQMVNILLELKEEHRNCIEGPLFFTEKTFGTLMTSAYINCKQPPIKVTNDGKLYSII